MNKLPSTSEKKAPKPTKKNEKKEIKSHFLGPTKRKKKKKEKLGSKIGKSKFDTPTAQPGEKNYIYLDTSGSEYLPSDDSISSLGNYLLICVFCNIFYSLTRISWHFKDTKLKLTYYFFLNTDII